MMLTDREGAMPLTFFYTENEGKKTSPQAYVREAIKRQQELVELCGHNTAQAQIRQLKKDDKILQAKPFTVDSMLLGLKWERLDSQSEI